MPEASPRSDTRSTQFRLQTLGRLHLELTAGWGTDGVHSQPKRLALLTYLVVARPRGLFRRDTLLSLFWPESDEDAARNSLSQSLHQLRRALGDDVIVTRGTQEVGVDAGRSDCDVIRFESLLDGGCLTGALELYAGPFLAGFHVPQAPDFERWADGERDRLAARYAQALRNLAESPEAKADPVRAVHWWRRLVDHDPLRGEYAAGLIRALRVQGAREEAVRIADVHAKLVREELALDVDPEVTRALHGVRVNGNGRGPESGEQAAALPPGKAKVEPESSPRETTASRLRLARVWTTMAVLAVAAGVIWVKLRPASSAEQERLAVIPFENRTGKAEHDELGTMVADWITMGLVSARLSEVSPLQLVREAAALTPRRPGEAVATRVARETGSTKVVTGTYYSVGDSIRFQGNLIDARTSQSLAIIGPISALPADVMQALEQMRHRTLGALAAQLSKMPDHYHQGGQQPSSLEVYRLSVRADLAFSKDLDEAERLQRQILAIDSGLQQHRLALAIILLNRGRYAEADSALQVVESNLDALGDRVGGFVLWARTLLAGDNRGTYELYSERGALAQVEDAARRQQFAVEARQLNRPSEALRAVAGINPRSFLWSSPQVWWTEAEAYHMLGDHAAELKSIRKGRTRLPRSALLARAEAATLAAGKDLGQLDKTVAAARSLPPDPWAGTHGDLLVEVAEELFTHGDSTHGREYANQAVAWYSTRPVAERNQLRYQEMVALKLTGRSREAIALLPASCETGWEREPPMVMWSHGEGLNCKGWTGVLVAELGDTTSARRQAEIIAGLVLSPRVAQKSQSYWLAAIAAATGDLDAAVEHLRDAFNKGEVYGVWPHRDPLFAALRNHPGFQELLRPKG